jgi:phage terminase large subunit-like protein
VGGFEVACHTTGLYPSWWQGRRFESPTRWWVAGDSIEACRDNPQRMLLGHNLDEMLGTGIIPKALIGRVTRKQIPDSCDKAYIKHVSGGWSVISHKSYDQGRRKWQGATLHGIWFDEEPPADIYSEGLARLTNTNGICFLTLTPLEGMTKVVGLFYPNATSPERWFSLCAIEDSGLYSEEEIARKSKGYQPHEREARLKGLPMLGTGQVYPIEESRIRVPWFDVPGGWPQLIGMDFGDDHPTAAVKIAYDKQNDCVYVTKEYRQAEESFVVHARAIKAMGGDSMTVVWPHDGWQQADRAGRNEATFAELYRKEGVRMWPEHATFPDGGYGTVAAADAIFDRMRTGRFKVFDTCAMWFEECRRYHKKDGKIQKQFDDLQSATHKAVMMLRVARPPISQQIQPRGGATAKPVAGWDPFESLTRKGFG